MPPPVVTEVSPEDTALIHSAYRQLLRALEGKMDTEDKDQVRHAFELAAEAHSLQRRKSGEPYITHPIEVAIICIEEIGLGPTAAVCALLFGLLTRSVPLAGPAHQLLLGLLAVDLVVNGVDIRVSVLQGEGTTQTSTTQCMLMTCSSYNASCLMPT